MSIEKISERILSEAKAEAEALLGEARLEAEKLLKDAKDEAEALKKESSARAESDAALLKERRRTAAELEAKKLILSAKQEMIEKSFSLAENELSELPEEDYLAFLKKQLPEDSEGGVLLLNERDKARGLAEKLGYKAAEETADIAGGFILRRGDVDINASIESIIGTKRKELTAEVARILFDGAGIEVPRFAREGVAESSAREGAVDGRNNGSGGEGV